MPIHRDDTLRVHHQGNPVTITVQQFLEELGELGSISLPVVVATVLPTVDPEVEGQLWSNAGIVTVSAGAP